MNQTMTQLSDDDLKAALEETGTVRSLQIVQAAMAGGIVVFGVVVAALSTATQAEPAGTSLAPILSLVHVLMAGSAGLFAAVTDKIASRVGRQPGTGTDTDTSAYRLVGALRGATILRLAVLEGAALFGLTVCLVAVMTGEMQSQPLYWLNTTTAVLFIIFALTTFPTTRGLLERLR